MKSILFFCIVLMVGGCTHHASDLRSSDKKVNANDALLKEESRALTTGALDSLSYAPTNPPTDLAKKFLRRDQQIEGMPAKRIDVEAILAGQAKAIADLDARFIKIDALLDERIRLEIENKRLTDALVEMGQKYEAERNKSIVRRLYGWLGFGGTIAAILALFVFFPPAIAIAGRLLAWIVTKLPGLASFVGVVGTKAFDATVRGVEKAKTALGDKVPALEAELGRSMDDAHKKLVRARKLTLL